MTTRAWLRNQRTRYEQEQQRETEDRDRGRQMEDMQMRLMQSEIDASRQESAARYSTGESAAPVAKKYMDMWNKSMQTTTGMFNKAMAGVDKGWDAIKDMQDNQIDFSGLSKDMETEWNNISEKFGGLGDQAIEMAGEEMTQRRELGKNLTSLAQPDYEGVAGRAMADVSGQAEMARKSEQRRMTGLGIDPTSGRGRSAMNTISQQETLSKATAANQARRGEKERSTDVTSRAMELIDPSKTAKIATDVQGAKNAVLGGRVDLARAEADIKGSQARAIQGMTGAAGNIAAGYSGAVTAPLGEAAGVYTGMAMQGGYNPISGRKAMPTSGGTGSAVKDKVLAAYRKAGRSMPSWAN